MIERRVPLTRKPFRRQPRRHREVVRGIEVISSEFDETAKTLVIRRTGGICEFPDCDKRGREFHHRLRRSQGGPGTPENCLLLCAFHHGYVHANVQQAYERGWLIRRGQPIA